MKELTFVVKVKFNPENLHFILNDSNILEEEYIKNLIKRKLISSCVIEDVIIKELIKK